MEIKRNGAQPSNKGPADWFTGTVRVDPLFQARDPARMSGASVTFEPGARTAWHTHPLGQTLIVTAGCGWVQCWGGPVEEIRPGRRDLDRARREALARRQGDDGDDPHRHPGSAERQGRRLDGEGRRRPVPGFLAPQCAGFRQVPTPCRGETFTGTLAGIGRRLLLRL